MLCKFTFVYPEGYADPERLEHDPEYIPGEDGPVEEYDVRLLDTAPQVGDSIEFFGSWLIATVDRYQSQKGDFYIATCTQDGKEPNQKDWSDRHPKILTVYPDDPNKLFDISDTPIAAGIQFQPVNGRPIRGYDLVIAA